jgi:hypothetical protein
MLIINNEEVEKLLTMADCIRVQEEAFKGIPTGGSIHRPRIDMYMPCDTPGGYYRWSTMEGANDAYCAIRMKSDIITWPKAEDGSRASIAASSICSPAATASRSPSSMTAPCSTCASAAAPGSA